MNLFEQVITSADQQHLTQNVQLRRLTTLVSRDEVNGQTDAPACFTSQLGLITLRLSGPHIRSGEDTILLI